MCSQAAACSSAKLIGSANAFATERAPLAGGLRPDVPAALDRSIQRALAKAPADRYASVAQFALALAPFGTARGRLAADACARALGEPTNPAPTVSRGRSSRWLLGTTAVLALLVVCVGAVALAISKTNDHGPRSASSGASSIPSSVGLTTSGGPVVSAMTTLASATAVASNSPTPPSAHPSSGPAAATPASVPKPVKPIPVRSPSTPPEYIPVYPK